LVVDHGLDCYFTFLVLVGNHPVGYRSVNKHSTDLFVCEIYFVRFVSCEIIHVSIYFNSP
jgi:hypothetical protein